MDNNEQLTKDYKYKRKNCNLLAVNCQLKRKGFQVYSEKSVLYQKAFRFSISAIKLCKKLKSNNEYVMSKQLLKSSTSIGANIKESKYAQSKKDFISKLNISLKEAGETEYWLELLQETKYITNKKADKLLKDVRELIKMLVSSIKTAKYNLRKENE